MSENSKIGMTRRYALKGGALAAAGLSAGTLSAEEGARPDPTKFPGAGPDEYGKRAPEASEKLARLPLANIVSLTPLQALHGTVTPSDLHFERHHAGIPEIDAAHHTLIIHGLVEKPLKFTLADLMRFPSVTRTAFLECSGNFAYVADAPERTSAQLLAGLTSQTEWTGVALSTLLREAGVKGSARWLLAEGGDAAVMTRSIPLSKALGDAMIAYAQNGEPLRPAQGYPFRLFLPGWEGNTSIKWLRRVEVGDTPAMTREETSKYSEAIKGKGARQFSFEMGPRSIITSPTYPAQIVKGWHEVRGLAWSGAGRVKRVEVSHDGGKNWYNAMLHGPFLPKAHTRFSFMWEWSGEETVLMSRAIDEKGQVQPTSEELVKSRGPATTPYHLNPVIAWRVKKSGAMVFAAAEMDLRQAFAIPSAFID